MFCRVEPRPRDAVKGRMLEFLQWRELLCSCNFANKGCHPQRVSDLLRGALHHPCMERCDSTGFSMFLADLVRPNYCPLPVRGFSRC